MAMNNSVSTEPVGFYSNQLGLYGAYRVSDGGTLFGFEFTDSVFSNKVSDGSFKRHLTTFQPSLLFPVIERLKIQAGLQLIRQQYQGQGGTVVQTGDEQEYAFPGKTIVSSGMSWVAGVNFDITKKIDVTFSILNSHGLSDKQTQHYLLSFAYRLHKLGADL